MKNLIMPFMWSIAITCFIYVALLPPPNNPKNLEKTKYCQIDSIYTYPKYDFTPELITTYHTQCGIKFSSYKSYKIGDSIQVKTIIIIIQ